MGNANDAFLKAIVENRADDAPRLIYADWLEEHGDALRAEFIRVQCELAKEDDLCHCWPENSPCRWCEEEKPRLKEREWELLNLPMPPQSSAFAWSMPLHSTGILMGRPWPELMRFRRGFVASITCPWADWRDNHARILAATPLEEVTLATPPEFSILGTFFGDRSDGPFGRYQLKGSNSIVTVDNTVTVHDLVVELLENEWKKIKFLFRNAITPESYGGMPMLPAPAATPPAPGQG